MTSPVKITAALDKPWQECQKLDAANRRLVFRVMQTIARMNKPYIQSSTLRTSPPVISVLGEAIDATVASMIVMLACSLYLYFGLASVSISTNPSGPKFLLLVKRGLAPGDQFMQNILGHLRIPAGEYKAPDAAALMHGKPRSTKPVQMPESPDGEVAEQKEQQMLEMSTEALALQ